MTVYVAELDEEQERNIILEHCSHSLRSPLPSHKVL